MTHSSSSSLSKRERSFQDLLSTSNPFTSDSVTTTSLEVIEKQRNTLDPIEKYRKWNFLLQKYFEKSQCDPEKLQQLKELVGTISQNTYLTALSNEVNKLNSLIKTVQQHTIYPQSAPIPIKYPSKCSCDFQLLSYTSDDESESTTQPEESFVNQILSLTDPTETLVSLEIMDAQQAMELFRYFLAHHNNSSKVIYVFATLNFVDLWKVLTTLDIESLTSLNHLLKVSSDSSEETAQWFKGVAEKIDRNFWNSVSQCGYEQEQRALEAYLKLTQGFF